ncbi:hypothetical protein FS749_013425 [Ceratobasidium sp. UAMH 11750]|nr:hypothetical protein FS749_013425 [Ceratobasidium sp. UAMH 11750]
MSSWTISGFVTNVSNAWERTFSSYKTVPARDASALLQEVDYLLHLSDKTLEKYRHALSTNAYEGFLSQSATYYLKLNKEIERHEKVVDAKYLPNHSASQLAADEAVSRTRAMNLLEVVRIYRSTLVEASHNAAYGSRPAFPDEESTPTDSRSFAEAQANADLSFPDASSREGYPAASEKQATSSTPGSRTVADYAPSDHTDDESAMLAVVHVLQTSVEASKPNRKVYKRIIFLRVGDRRLKFVDPKLHELEDDQVTVDNRKLAALYKPTMECADGLDFSMFDKLESSDEEEEGNPARAVSEEASAEEANAEQMIKTFEGLCLEIN